MEKENLILEFMKQKEYVPMKAKELASIFDIHKEEIEELKQILKKLELDGKITRNRRNRYAIHEIKTLVGTFKNNKSFGFVVPDNRKESKDIFISKKNFNGAKDNSKVVVQITKEETQNKKPEGKIIEVLGKIDEAGVDFLSIIKEYNLPYEFPKQVIEEAKKIAKSEELTVQNARHFDVGADASVCPDSKGIPNKNVGVGVPEDPKIRIFNRTDFRNDIVFTIDGEDAKDLDDAVSVEKTNEGNYKLSVHIADVSHYVVEGSLLDKEAILRGTSVYMLNKVIPMLPKELSNGNCSLNEGEDRLTLSVIMEIDDKGNVISSDVTKGIINVAKRMSYTGVQATLDAIESSKRTLSHLTMTAPLKNPQSATQTAPLNKGAKLGAKNLPPLSKGGGGEADGGFKNVKNQTFVAPQDYKPYTEQIKLMAELAHILENKRKKQGYLDLNIPESKITLDKNGHAIDVGKYENKFANQIIEQFMLTANETVAEKFYWLEAPFIYRVHETPDQEKISELNKFLVNFGYKIKGSKENIHPKAFSSILEDVKGKEEEKLISNLILRTLKVARYEAQNKGHFGIAGKYYCHFTSPIRRYPDLYIHRIISNYLETNYTPTQDYIEKHNELAVKYAEQSSEREKIVQKAERDSIDLKKAEYMEAKIGEVYEGIISGVTNFGLFVELENTVEGLIRFENLGDEYFEYDDQRKRLIGEQTKTQYKIGDKITIQVIEANKNLRKVAFAKYEKNR